MAKIPKRQKLPSWIDENLPPELATSTLFRFNVKLQAMEEDPTREGKLRRKQIEVDILPDLDLEYETVEEAMGNLPGQYAFWASVYSEVRLGVAVAERKLKARKAEVTKLIVEEFKAQGVTKSPAAETLKTIVEADQRLNEAELAFQHAQMQAGKLYHMLEALKMKAELARSLLGLKKQDRDNNG